MKEILLIISFVMITLNMFSQEPSKSLDVIYLNNGEIIETRIVRVNKRKVYYYDPKTYGIVEVSKEDVKDYEYNDEYFKTGVSGNLGHSEVVKISGFSKGEIFRAINDWFFVNSKGLANPLLIDDDVNFILLGAVNTNEYIKMDFLTAMAVLDDDPSTTNNYSLRYDVYVRVKDNRFKVFIP